MSFGAALKQAREAQGVTLHDVAQKTKIRLDYLRALEEGNVAALPERTFARSYLQRYARELGVDPAPLLSDFDRSMPQAADFGPASRQPTSNPGARVAAPAPVARRGLNPLWLVAGVLLLGSALYGVNTLMTRPQTAATPVTEPAPVTETPTPEETPAPQSVNLSVSSVPAGARVYLDNRELGVTPLQSFPVDARATAELRVELSGRAPLRTGIALTRGRNLRVNLATSGQGASTITDLARPAATAVTPPAATPAGTPAAAEPATPAAPRSPVSVTFSGAAWTRVTDASGRVLYEGTPPAGSAKGFPAGVLIRTGNAGAVKVSVNGGPATPMGAAGQVLSRRY